MDMKAALNPPNGAEAIDLSTLKGPTDVERRALRKQGLVQNHLYCPCGVPMPDPAFMVYVIREDLVMDQQTRQPAKGMTFGQIMIHSPDCPVVAELGEEAVAIRQLPPQGKIRWLQDV